MMHIYVIRIYLAMKLHENVPKTIHKSAANKPSLAVNRQVLQSFFSIIVIIVRTPTTTLKTGLTADSTDVLKAGYSARIIIPH